jgi:rod shape determining protein RodA
MAGFLAFVAKLWERIARPIDSMLMAAAVALVGVGLVTLFSATEQNVARVTSQAVSLGFALVLMWLVANVSPQQLARTAVPLYAIAVLLLVAVALGGTVVNHSRRWLNLGIGRFQPSELMKIALPLMLAWYFQKREARMNLGDFIIAAVLIAVPVWLIERQPDLGTALMVGACGFYVLYLAGLSWKVMLALGAAATAAVPLVWPHLHGYRQERILTFLDPSRDPLGAGYHSSQASIALGSGGVIGKGWLNGTQTHLDFLPERHTDFIFTMLGEELGMVGGLLVLALYSLLVVYGLAIALRTRSHFGRLLAFGVTMNIFLYFFINTAMVMGLIPVVGIPLPLISYGGTAMMTVMVGFGLLMAVYIQRDYRVGRRTTGED